MKRLALLALVCTAVTGCAPAPAQTQTTGLLRPGGTITGAGGVQVSAPPHWREGPEAGVLVTITRLDRSALTWPIDADRRLGLPIYRVEAEVPVLTADRGRFTVSIPTAGADPAFLFGLRLSTVIIDSDGPGGSLTTWTDDDSAGFSGGHLTFGTTGFVDETHLFTASRLDSARTWSKH